MEKDTVYSSVMPKGLYPPACICRNGCRGCIGGFISFCFGAQLLKQEAEGYHRLGVHQPGGDFGNAISAVYL